MSGEAGRTGFTINSPIIIVSNTCDVVSEKSNNEKVKIIIHLLCRSFLPFGFYGHSAAPGFRLPVSCESQHFNT